MLVEKAVQALLSDTPSLGGRVFPDVAPQGTPRPYATFHRIATRHEHHIGGPCGLEHVLLNITVVDDERMRSLEISDSIAKSLGGYIGIVESIDICGIQISGGPRTSHEPKKDATDEVRYHCDQDFEISATEEMP